MNMYYTLCVVVTIWDKNFAKTAGMRADGVERPGKVRVGSYFSTVEG